MLTTAKSLRKEDVMAVEKLHCHLCGNLMILSKDGKRFECVVYGCRGVLINVKKIVRHVDNVLCNRGKIKPFNQIEDIDGGVIGCKFGKEEIMYCKNCIFTC